MSDLSEKIDALEIDLLNVPQVECNVVHKFFPGLYVREVTVPAGTYAIGHYQKTAHMNIFISGAVSVINEDGAISDLIAPMIFMAQPGRKVGYIHKDMVWWNVYQTNETDVEKLEETYIKKSDGWKDAQKRIEQHKKLLIEAKTANNNNDYLKLLDEVGITEQQVQEIVQDESDRIEMPNGSYKFKIGKSNIHGKGVIATSSIAKNELIGKSRINDKRTPLGRFCNHSLSPNAKMIWVDGDIWLSAITDISGCHGGFDGEEITVNYRESLKLIGEIQCQQ